MTQEELDALLESGVDLSEIEDTSEVEESVENLDEEDPIMPPPADEKHKVVAQLDEVTKESEKKASEILDIITNVSEEMDEFFNKFVDIKEFLIHQKELFEKLHKKFPHIKTFEIELQNVEEKLKEVDEILEKREKIESDIMTVFEIMQYQDIHRQKIERVINIMRALIRYMNKLFEGKVEDEDRVSSAKHIVGDSNEVVSDEDIEELLKQFGA